MMKWMNNKKK